MRDRQELSSILEDYLKGLEFPAEPDSLYEPISYSLESGGKRIRPLLTMMACGVFSEGLHPALPCSAAVEVFHSFTPLHDDIMDNASLSPGLPAVRRPVGENSAILSGAAMAMCPLQLLEQAGAQLLP